MSLVWAVPNAALSYLYLPLFLFSIELAHFLLKVPLIRGI